MSGAPRAPEGLAPEEGCGDGWPTHRLFGLYLFVSGLALLFPDRPATWPLLAVLHLCGGALARRDRAGGPTDGGGAAEVAGGLPVRG